MVPVVLFESVDKRLNTDSPAVDVLIIFSYLSCISMTKQAIISSVVDYYEYDEQIIKIFVRGGICPCRQCRRQCKNFPSGVNFSVFTHFLCFFLPKLLKLGTIDGVKFLA